MMAELHFILFSNYHKFLESYKREKHAANLCKNWVPPQQTSRRIYPEKPTHYGFMEILLGRTEKDGNFSGGFSSYEAKK